MYGQAVTRGRSFQEEYAAAVTLGELREIHRLVVEPVWARFPPDDLPRGQKPGDFRQSNVEALRRGLIPPDWPHVHPQLTDWVERANDIDLYNPRFGHFMEDLADVHAAFERIHPFPDGNGRVGRLTLNLLLVRHGYPPAVINKRDRERYLDGLHRADDGDPGLLGEVLARSVEHGINRFLIPGLAGPHRWVPLASLADETMSYNALILAAQRGRLRAELKGDRWYSSRHAVEEYKRSRYRRTRGANP